MKRNCSSGFTAIEVLAATALASILMVVVLGVLTGIARKEKLLDTTATPVWQDRIVGLLTADLSSATSFRQERGMLTIESCGGDALSINSDWLPVEIRYTVVQVGDDSLLLRIVKPRLQTTSKGRSELVCIGVDSISLYEVAESLDVATGEIAELANGITSSRLRVALTDKGQRVLDRLLVLF